MERTRRKTILNSTFIKCSGFVLLSLIMWEEYVKKIINIEEQSSTSYFQYLQAMIQQLNGELPSQTIYANMHGAVYPILLAYLAKLFGIEGEAIVFYVQGVIVIGAIMFCGAGVWYWRKSFWPGLVSSLCAWGLCKDYFLYDFNYSYWGGQPPH